MTTPAGRWADVRRPDGTIRNDWVPAEQPPSPDGSPGEWHVVAEEPGGPGRWEWHPAGPAGAPRHPSAIDAPAPAKKRRRRWPWIVAGVLGVWIVLATIVRLVQKDEQPEVASPPAIVTAPPAAEPAPIPSAPASALPGPSTVLPMQNGEWRLDSLTINADGSGRFDGVGLITYTGVNPAAGGTGFTVTIFVADTPVGVLKCSLTDAVPEAQQSCDLSSTDAFLAGEQTWTFQHDL